MMSSEWVRWIEKKKKRKNEEILWDSDETLTRHESERVR